MTTAILPEVLVDEIKKMACIKKSNGKKGNNFIIICKYKGKDTKSTIKKIYEWLFSCLNNIRHPAVWDGHQFYWNIILNYYGAPGEDEDKNEENSVYFYIHTSKRREGMDAEGLIYEMEDEPFIEMSANYILEHIGYEPENIVGVGISAVSNEFMAKQWWEEIEGREGFMIRPMWNRWAGVSGKDGWGWSDIREKSFNFGWKNYPPAEINQLLTKEMFQKFIQTNFNGGVINDQSHSVICCLNSNFNELFENLIEHGDMNWT